MDKIIAINKTSAAILNFPNKTEIIYDYIDFSNRSETTDFKKLSFPGYIAPLIKIFGLPFATLSPITVIPGNLPTITSSRDVAAGEIEKPDEGFETLLFCVPQEQNKTKININV